MPPEIRPSLGRTLETAAIATAASLAVMGVVGYVLVRQEDRRLKEATRRARTAPGELIPGTAGPSTNTSPSTTPPTTTNGGSPGPDPLPIQPQRLVGDALPLAPGRRYLAAVDVNFPLSLAATSSKVRSQAEGMGFRDVVVAKDRPPPGVVVPVQTGADYYILGTYARDPATIGRSHAAGRVEVLDAWMIG